MARKPRPQKITFGLWARLQTGNISCVSFGAASLRKEGGQFKMDGPGRSHFLSINDTDPDRLNEHWQGFASAVWAAVDA